jgi:hypothetical protein
MLSKIREGMQEYSRITLFVPTWLKCSLPTRVKLSSLIGEDGKIEGTGLSVLIDDEIPINTIRIGMGQGPTYSECEI